MTPPPPGRMAGKVALITGGASGLGFATARRLVRDGARVALADVDEDRLRAAVAELGAGDGQVRAYRLDVRDAANVGQVVGQACADFGAIDVLVNSAGVSHQGSVLDNTLDAWDRVIGINLTGSYLCTQAVARHMAERRAGRIVFLASISGQQVWSGRVAYSSSKGGVLALAKSCAIDLAPFGITVNSVSPGPIETPQTATLHNEIVRNAIVSATPMARYGRPDEVADVIAFLASDDARFVTGHDLVVDGGLTSAAILYDLAKNPQPV
ncbi:SDR family NAD(P)-dependent oxidoreductase [Pseudorhodoferax sp.]|uniref:SDR family NAD(P)-dependent oxidoreductase n=1 Tax=Pseudorhodoferax sp. TaxID=1993553 RepID=UPI0039E40539